MELINQHTKKIMEGCKERARKSGLRFGDETLEYIVTNTDLIELSSKHMIPTLYDYWVNDVEVLKEKGRYELYPNNPYETVINTRPAISFYNDNNPDWLNVMIFYHVLAHIDFFQNNTFFKHTWDEDFAGRALSDKRSIAMLRSEKGRWVDYVIEFSRSIDNLVGFHSELSELNQPGEIKTSAKLDFYFDIFLQTIRKVNLIDYLKEIDRYNEAARQFGEMSETLFFSQVTRSYPEFDALFDRHKKQGRRQARDLLDFLLLNSAFLQKEENRWMQSVIEIVRKTSLYFQPQIRTKILNEGWASYWHEKLFLKDDRIRGNEVGFARVNALVTSLPRIGLNPYALGMRLFSHIEEMADKGKMSYDFQRLQNAGRRRDYDKATGSGLDHIFRVREDFNDFTFINSFVDQEFVDRHKLFVTGARLNPDKGTREYYVRSRDAGQYRQMVLDQLYHPPFIEIEKSNTEDNCLCLNHHFEGKPLVKEFISNTMIGIEYLWGGPVKLETSEPIKKARESYPGESPPPADREPSHRRVLYTMKDRQLSRTLL
ncbi:MAG: SpoVR family protein [Syntrophobacteraceae bacterium]|nr:SpoVR family protein [Syntrophobacteraceae bacterium]